MSFAEIVYFLAIKIFLGKQRKVSPNSEPILSKFSHKNPLRTVKSYCVNYLKESSIYGFLYIGTPSGTWLKKLFGWQRLFTQWPALIAKPEYVLKLVLITCNVFFYNFQFLIYSITVDSIVIRFEQIGLSYKIVPLIHRHSTIDWFKNQFGTWNELYRLPFAEVLTSRGFGFSFNVLNASDLYRINE